MKALEDNIRRSGFVKNDHSLACEV